MRDTARKPERLNELTIDLEQRFRVGGIARQGSRGEYAAVVRGVQGRRAIAVRLGEEHFAFGNDAVDVKDVSGQTSIPVLVDGDVILDDDDDIIPYLDKKYGAKATA